MKQVFCVFIVEFVGRIFFMDVVIHVVIHPRYTTDLNIFKNTQAWKLGVQEKDSLVIKSDERVSRLTD